MSMQVETTHFIINLISSWNVVQFVQTAILNYKSLNGEPPPRYIAIEVAITTSIEKCET